MVGWLLLTFSLSLRYTKTHTTGTVAPATLRRHTLKRRRGGVHSPASVHGADDAETHGDAGSKRELESAMVIALPHSGKWVTRASGSKDFSWPTGSGRRGRAGSGCKLAIRVFHENAARHERLATEQQSFSFLLFNQVFSVDGPLSSGALGNQRKHPLIESDTPALYSASRLERPRRAPLESGMGAQTL